MRFAVFCFYICCCLLESTGASAQFKELVFKQRNINEDLQEINEALAVKEQHPDSSRKWLLTILRRNYVLQNRDGLRKCLTALSGFTNAYDLQSQTIQYAKRGIQLCDTQKHKRDLLRLYDNIGSIYFKQSRYQESLEARFIALHYAQSISPLEVAKIENNIAEVFRLFGNPVLAQKYLDHALEIGVTYQHPLIWSSALMNISRLKETSSAKDHYYLDSGLYVAHRFGLYKILYNGLHNKSSLLVNNGKPREALLLLEAADTLSRYFFITPVLKAKANEIQGTAYAALGEYTKAEQLFLKSLYDTDPMGWLRNMTFLTHLYEIQGDFKNAYYTFRKFQNRVNEVGNNDIRLKVNDLELQYRTSEKDKELAINKLMLIQKDNALKWKNTGIALLTAAGLTLSCIIFLLRRNNRQKQKIQLSEQINLQLKARIEGEERERKRISQELHDGIGGILVAAKMNLSGVDPLTQEQAPRLEQGVQLLDDAYKELRQTAHNLSPHVLKAKGLIPTLYSFCKRTAAAKNIDIKLQYQGKLEALREETSFTTYRIIQELVQNIVKHSDASIAMIQLNYEDGYLDITVEDNGKGISDSQPDEGIGLVNIRDRVAALNGYMDIDSRLGEGTTIYINIMEHSI